MDYRIRVDKLKAVAGEQQFNNGLCYCCCSGLNDWLPLVACLNPSELAYFKTLKFEKRIRSYLLGRFVAKKAVAAVTATSDLSGIIIQHGIFTQPMVVAAEASNIQVSITHSEDFGAAVAFREAYPMGIDLEKVSCSNRAALERQTTRGERVLLGELTLAYDFGLTLCWTAKEALSKVLKTGLTTPFEIFEIAKLETGENCIKCCFKNFSQYQALSFEIGGFMCSIVYPLVSQLDVDIEALKNYFSNCTIIRSRDIDQIII